MRRACERTSSTSWSSRGAAPRMAWRRVCRGRWSSRFSSEGSSLALIYISMGAAISDSRSGSIFLLSSSHSLGLPTLMLRLGLLSSRASATGLGLSDFDDSKVSGAAAGVRITACISSAVTGFEPATRLHKRVSAPGEGGGCTFVCLLYAISWPRFLSLVIRHDARGRKSSDPKEGLLIAIGETSHTNRMRHGHRHRSSRESND